ncbi:MAG TPA: autotransporter outer membrane beta-barrel domain-containing protein [Caulobacteraceae bacterium]
MGGTNNGREFTGRANGATPPRRSRHRREALLCAAAAGAVALSLASSPRAEASPTVDIVEMLDIVPGSTVINPDTGLPEVVTKVLSPPGVSEIVLTADNNVIVLYSGSLGDSVELQRYNATTKQTITYDYTVTNVYTNSTTGDVDSVQLELNGSNPKVYKTLDLVSSSSSTTINSGGPGSGTQDKSPAPTAGTKIVVKQGAPGGDGNAGVGVSFGLFTIEYAPGDGGAGSPGPYMHYVLTHDYNSNVANTAAIEIISIGGDGGDGGASVGNIPAGNGGPAGVGGNVSVTASGTIATHKDNSPGLWAESQGGHGGSGGGGLFLGSGGGGGGATQGGDVYVDLTTTGLIHTYGNASPGILAESLGGSGGNGGLSVGIVGTAGDASYGGNGGNVRVHQNGVVITEGNFSYGVLAESIGGNGGDAGSSYAVVTLGDQGAGGGSGALAAIYAGGNSITITHGDYAIGLFAESIGGGGGNGGSSGGLVTLGTYGAGGGNGGEAKVVLDAGAYVYTKGNASIGVEAQSIGGGGGSGGSSIAIAALGSEGAGGGNASLAAVYSSGDIVTEGNNAMGILVQSIGGGGGDSGAADGVVALGGTSSVGGNGAEALVKLYAGSEVLTHGYGSDGVVAQSIGGGGGVGASNGGLVALGASGGGGGDGGKVGVYNYGLIATTGDQSRGIFAESIGGGGGHGGDSGGLAAVGGNATTGGTGGDVYVTNAGEIFTGGNMSAGIEAQSIGGGGGDGGNSGGVVLAVGGTAGSGGGSAYNGGSGKVTVNDSGFIQTTGNDSDGIFAQSVGGGGGNGGSATSVSAFVGVAIGGQGGNGGAGGDVYVNLSPGTVTLGNTTITGDPQIITTGDRSAGIFEESVGGGGGNGGAATQVAIGYIGAISIAIGGAGGDGGDGGNVHISGDAQIETHGNNSDGIDIQSVGGGGGTGGFAIAIAASGGIAASGAISVGVGGTGGNGGKGGGVYGDTGGTIYTYGNFSTGLLAQSVGGGGGAGGFAISVTATGSGGVSGAVSVGVGGNGGGGGDGGTVDVTFDGSITTKGAYATGALIQSVGGGGGSGGFDISAGVTGSAGASGDLAVGIGGSGAHGGYGGTVTGDVTGNVVTYGNHSDGVVVQSVGGGGGNGGFNVSGAIAASGGGALAVTVGLGGTGAGGGHGGDVYGYAGAITTHGNYSYGFIAQSVGGGGGSGGFNVSGDIAGAGTGAGAVSVGLGGNAGAGGYGETVHGHVSGTVVTYGDFSGGVVIQSVGGGGGEGGFNVSGALSGSGVGAGSVTVGLGGTGGDGGVGGNVYGYAAAIATHGDHSAGFVAQSVGGGGGSGGFDVSGALSGSGTGAGAVSVGIGGGGGGGGDAGNVTGNVSGVVVTYGNQSDGVVVQSIGGGGGDGGFHVAGSISGAGEGAGSVSVGVGGGGGKAGDSATVHAYALSISTHGDNSTGFLAQSVGGGGGNGGFDVSGSISGAGTGAGTVSVGVGGAGAYGGHGGNVYAGVIGNVTTAGNFSDGVVAQSLGGGGGNGGFNVAAGVSGSGEGAGSISVGVGGSGGTGGYAGNVTLTIAGATYTQGNDSDAVLAQSVGGGGGNGGFNVTGDISVAGTGAGTLGVGVGGTGGGGGAGGNVTLNVTGVTINGELIAAETNGDYSRGVVAQSIGGGGGSGGFDVTAGISGAETGAGNIGVGVGGSGGTASSGGVVISYVTGDVFTDGKGSVGVLVQSVGGGGGAGGFNVTGGVSGSGEGSGNIGVGVGGFGGGGGAGGVVYAGITGNVQTLGDSASAITFQSMGGGGGDGGFNVTGGIAIAAQSGGLGGNIGVGVGGFGGDGGTASNVTGTVDGNVITTGDDSHGILMQSVGGGGGDGGFNVSGGVAASTGSAGNIEFGLGGFGGKGGVSGNVYGNVTGNVWTEGDNAFGVTMQSLGGGGGDGGFNVTGGVALTLGGTGVAGDIGIGVGGFGGGGGNAGGVYGNMTGNVVTYGANAHGILMQSAGGGGGDGGFNITGDVAIGTGATGAVSIGVGGFGGGAGNGGNVTGYITGNVFTYGAESFGVMEESVGGGGGDGGMNITGSLSVSVKASTSVAVGIGLGGFGGYGGHAGDVTGGMYGVVVTHGNDAPGVVAASLGGGGGAGGLDVTGDVALSLGSAGTVGIGVGGFGGVGGYAGNVTFVRVGDTETDGINSDGVVAESIGGGGGDGGLNVTGSVSASTKGATGAIGIGVGGFGGGGGDAGNVSLSVTGNVYALGAGASTIFTPSDGSASYTVTPDGSNGVVAQSIGGGGGNGGIDITGSLAITTPGGSSAGNAATIGLGGFGGSGGNAGTVHLSVQGANSTLAQVVATGDDKSAVIAQSIGGGGGDGGINISGGAAIDGTFVVGIGGSGANGGIGGNVYATVDANLYASGRYSRGLVVQSIGGGGGDGAINISGGITADTASTQPNLTFGIGGFGGAGAASGNVVATQYGQVDVVGAGAIGILAQSVAGGGGSGGLDISADVNLGKATSKTQGVGIAVGVGGSGGTGADSGDVTLYSVGNVFVDASGTPTPTGVTPPTANAPASEFSGAAGVMAQSIGGGGGVGGMNITGAIAPFGSPAAIGVGGTGADGGNAGNVTVIRGYLDESGVLVADATQIVTKGDGADGLVAQSIGGGGGDAGMNFVFGITAAAADDTSDAAIINVGGGSGDGGNAAKVTVHDDENIFTYGVASTGLLAQSIGGGGGNSALNIGAGLTKDSNTFVLTVGGAIGNGGNAGDVIVYHTGDIITTGTGAMGIEAESIGGGGGSAFIDQGYAYGASNSLTISIGRDGGTGGIGGNVSVHLNGIIETAGQYANGILAQSIGGGGGASSSDSVGVGATNPKNDKQTGGVSVNVGLTGGTGAVGGNVYVGATGDILTSGDSANGIMAQSIGGGGGAGGGNVNVVFQNTAALSVSVGGNGGVAATSGTVYVDTSATIVTQGYHSDGVLAQSIGGGGGAGGSDYNLALQIGGQEDDATQRTIAVNVGGQGSSGSFANTVNVLNTGVIVTNGVQSEGIEAESIGGGGGTGGGIIDATLQGTNGSDALDVNVGGFGGTGGAGGTVIVTNQGQIFTYGEQSDGILAASIGGGGGTGGTVLQATLGASGDNTTHRISFNMGGFGGSGGTGGNVTVINEPSSGAYTGQVVTHGQDAYGILALSIGGGGGQGGAVADLFGMTAGKDSASFTLNIGGFGGTGGDAGTVTVDNSGLVDTYGDGAHGIVAQSIGGGGGDGGIALSLSAQIGSGTTTQQAPMITIGGQGGDGGNGGTVTVTNTGEIITHGANADGILAESIGGGGGDANVGLSLEPGVGSMALSNSISLLVGATGGGAGGTAGAVTVNQAGNITVLGQGSQAIDAESINGGGGTLSVSFDSLVSLPGFSFFGNSNPPSPTDPVVAAQAGASKASGSSGGDVTINMTGTIGEGGDDSVGVFEQSIGGGGGTIRAEVSLGTTSDVAGYSVGGVGFQFALGGSDGTNNNGGDITSVQTGEIMSTGANSPGALVQSIGGGGGRSILDIYAPSGSVVDPISVSLGGTDGTNEAGGNIVFTHDGMIGTTGELSTGEIIQSIGGGGGDASVDVHGADADAVAVQLVLGSTGGTGLSGGDITATFNGGVITEGDHANGLFVQSVGGGGGEARIEGAGSLDVTLGGGEGDGGNVTLINTGGIYTFGDGSNGVFLQSIGGGGGAAFIGIDPPSVTLSGAGIGNGGDIVFTQTGDIFVMGADSTGIIAQSIGGGGGYVEGAFHGTAGGVGQGGSIELTIDGKVMALENNSTGIFAESTGSLGGGDITIDAEDAIRGGSGTGMGIYVDGGADNLITTTTSLSAVSGVAITTTFGNDTVDNTGTVVGDIFLGGGVNAFNNELGSTFIAFHTIALQDASAGSTGTFTNSGEFQMGLSAPLVPIDLLNGATFGNLDADGDPRFNLLYGARVIETVNLTGNFVQTSAGHLDFDVAFGPYPSDLVNVSGNTTVAGTGNVILTWLQDNHPVTLFATKGTATNDGLQIAPTIAIDYGIIANNIGIQLTIQTNFGQPFLTPNEQRLGHHMDSAVDVGGSAGIGRLLAYLGNMTSGQQALYAAVFDQLNPEPLVAPLRAQMLEANQFGDDLFGCLSTTTTTVDKDCVWVKGGGFTERGNAEGGYWDSREIGQTASGGWQRPINGEWSMTAAAGYQAITDLSVNNGRGRASGQGGDLGVGFQRRTPDGLALGFGVTGGWTSLDMARQVDVIGMLPPGVGRSNVQTGYAQVQVNASKLYTYGKWFVRPEVQATSTMLRTNAFAETGLAGIGVKSDGDTHFIEAAQPDLAFGRVIYENDKQRAELTFKIGGRFSTNDDLFLPISFIGAGQGARPAFIQTPYNSAAGVASVGLTVFGSGPLSVSADYTNEFGKSTSSQRGSLDFKFTF